MGYEIDSPVKKGMELSSTETEKAVGEGAVGKSKASVWNMLNLTYL